MVFLTWLLVGVWVLDLLISIWNSYVAGKAWVEARHVGGWQRFMCWMAAIQSASGFSWCYLLVVALVATQFNWLPQRWVRVFIELGYVTIIPFLLFSAVMITVESWRRAYRNRDVPSMGLATYNTLATAYDLASAVEGIGPILGDIYNAFAGSDDSEDSFGFVRGIVAVIVVCVLTAGVLTTYVLVRHWAGSESIPARQGAN